MRSVALNTLTKCLLVCGPYRGGSKSSKNLRATSKILGARWMKWSKFHAEDRTNFSRPAELSPWICAPLSYVTKYYAQRAVTAINLLATDFFFQILAHPVFKMWVIQKPNKVALWNKRHFEDKKWRLYSMFKIFGTDICWINIKWGI